MYRDIVQIGKYVFNHDIDCLTEGTQFYKISALKEYLMRENRLLCMKYHVRNHIIDWDALYTELILTKQLFLLCQQLRNKRLKP